MEGRIESNNIVNINKLFLMKVIEIMEIFKIYLIGKTPFYLCIIYTWAETPCSSRF